MDLGEVRHITPRRAFTYLAELAQDGFLTARIWNAGRGRVTIYSVNPDSPSLPLVPLARATAEA